MNFIRDRMCNINPVSISILIVIYEQPYKNCIRIGRHLGCAKRQLEVSLRSQLNRAFPFVY